MNLGQIILISSGVILSLAGIYLLIGNSIAKFAKRTLQRPATPIKESPVESPIPPIEPPKEKIQSYYQMGRDFEEYVMHRFLVKKQQFKILNQRHDQLGPDGKPLPDNSNPDLEIEALWKERKQAFAVECKFRSRWEEDRSLEWCKDHNLKNYREFAKARNIPVFVVLGVGGSPSSPIEMFCFKLTENTTTRVSQRDMHALAKPPYPGFFYHFLSHELQFKGYPA